LAQLLAADAIQPEFRKQALIEIGKRALGRPSLTVHRAHVVALHASTATKGAFELTGGGRPEVRNSFELFEKGAIDATIQCLKSQDDEVLELASRALINITVDGAHPLLLPSMHAHAHAPRSRAWRPHDPPATEPSRDDVYDGGGIPLLVNLLQRPNENIQANALWALINLTNNGAWQRWPSTYIEIYIYICFYMRDVTVVTNKMFSISWRCP
jgi:hypothetical protein